MCVGALWIRCSGWLAGCREMCVRSQSDRRRRPCQVVSVAVPSFACVSDSRACVSRVSVLWCSEQRLGLSDRWFFFRSVYTITSARTRTCATLMRFVSCCVATGVGACVWPPHMLDGTSRVEWCVRCGHHHQFCLMRLWLDSLPGCWT